MTLHVRVVTPPDVTELLVDVLVADSGVSNVLVLTGSARRPVGDAVHFDVLTRSANSVLGQLRALQDDHRNSIVIENVDAHIGEGADPAATSGLVQKDAAPIWDVVEAKIRTDAVYAPSFFILLAIAGLIGAVGILTNSQILIVGAMVVGPEYNAIMGVALGIDKRDRGGVGEGLLALILGFFAAIAVTLAFGVAVRAAGNAPKLFLVGVRPVSDLINAPNIFSVVVAILAGIVGVVSLTESRANALIGVFISVTTIPAAADIGGSLAFGSWHEARGSALQLLLNVVLLIVVGAAGLSTQRPLWRVLGARQRTLPPGLPRSAGGLGGSGRGLGANGGGISANSGELGR